MSKKKQAPRAFQVAAAIIGNALEWYDFLIFGFLTVVVSKLFFPATSEYGSLLMTTATFGVGFFMRPIGGIVIGMLADRLGRKIALQLVIALTTVSMLLMAVAPTYQTAGLTGALVIVLARLMQGFATGGEFASSTAYLVECAPPNKRGLYGSWQMFGQALAMILGNGVGALITNYLSPHDLNSWGFRVPFLLGMLIGPVGFWIRNHLEESKEFLAASSATPERMSLFEVFNRYRRGLLVGMGLITCGTISTYVLNIYMPTFASKHLHIPLNQAFIAELCGGIVVLCCIPFYAMLSDRIGRKKILVTSMVTYLLALYPLFTWLCANPCLKNLLIMQCVFALIKAGYGSVVASVLAEQFPTKVRSTGMSVSYNVAVMTFGGSAQFFITWLINVTGSPVSAVYYLLFGAVVGFISSLFVRDTIPESINVPSGFPHTEPERQAVM